MATRKAKAERKRMMKFKPIVRGQTKEGDEVLGTVQWCLDNIERHQVRLIESRIGVAWTYRVRSDADGRLMLAKAKKVGGVEREFVKLDFLLIVNHGAWKQLDTARRKGLIDHELTHCDYSLDKVTGEAKRDDLGRICYRIAKHDVEEFYEVASRNGGNAPGISPLRVLLAQGTLFQGMADVSRIRPVLDDGIIDEQEVAFLAQAEADAGGGGFATRQAADCYQEIRLSDGVL